MSTQTLLRMMCLLVCLFFTIVGAAQAVDIPDPNLRAAIETTLGKTTGASITVADMETLTLLTARNANISNLTGLEHATNLTRLDLITNSISDLSPISGLTKLALLRLRGNTISSITAISGLTNLTTLNLDVNHISSITAISGLTNLTRLTLYNNSISDISPLSGLTNLTWLDLNTNRVSNITAISGLTNLTGLTLYNNSISDLSPLVSNTGLGAGETVDVRENPLNTASINTHIPALQQRGVEVLFDAPPPVTSPTVNIPDPNLRRAVEAALGKAAGASITVADMETLTSITARNANISNLTGLEHATNLTVLDLFRNSISDLSPLSGLTNLTRLDLDVNSISALSPLSGLTNLTTLNLGGNSISALSPLSGLTNLTGLGLASNNISNISPLSGLTNLTYLDLLHNNISNISPLSGLTNLTYLRLGDNSISDLSPLVSNTGLGAGETVDARGNPLNTASINTHIPILQGRGVTVLFDAPPPVTSPAVNIPDPNLRRAIEAALGKAAGASITVADMETLTSLTARNANISNLTGLEHATNLTRLGLFNNQISDISPLSGLTNLTFLTLNTNRVSNITAISELTNLTGLTLYNNRVSDLSPLVSNIGLGAGATVDARMNPLNTASINTHIPTLQQRGVTVSFDPPQTVTSPAVNIPDPNLRRAVEAALGKAAGASITVADMETLTSITARNANISNLTGLEHASNLTSLLLENNSASNLSPLAGLTNLRTLYLDGNSISNITPLSGLINMAQLDLEVNSISDVSALAGLTNLRWLNLNNNSVSDLSPLVSNTGLGSGDTVGVERNPLSSQSHQTHIPALQGRGVTVHFDAPQTVNIPDPNLRRAIEAALGKAAGSPITTDEMTNLTSLTARNANISNLTGLEHASNLTSLLLENNSASNLSPLAGLTNLRTLYLDGNSISNITPLSGLINLVQLDLEVNSISDVSALAGLTNLRWLNLNNNSVSDLSPLVSNTGLGSGDTVYVERNPLNSQSHQTHIPALQGRGVTVHFDAAAQTVNIPDPNLRRAVEAALGKAAGAPITVADMEALTSLTARDANISNLTGLEHATNLTDLGLDENSISDVSALSGLTNLWRLTLNSNSISDVSALSGLTNLSRLKLYENSISDVSALAGLTSLTWLNLGYNTISDASALAGLTNLTGLQIYHNTISDLSPLVANTGLGSGEEVNVEGNPLNTASINTHIPALQQRGVTVFFDPPQTVTSPAVNIPDPNLRMTIAEALFKETAGAPITVAEMETLTWLGSLDNISNLTGLEHATNLTELDLAESSISDLSPLSGLTSLTHLNLAGSSISDLSPLSDLTNLTWLYLVGNSISDLSPLVANTGLGSGEEVYVHGNPLSSQSLQTHIPALQRRGVTVHFDALQDQTSDQTSVLVVEGTITNIDGSSAEAGLNVTVTIGSLIQTTVSETGGDYRVTFISPAGGVASSSDTVIVQVRRQSTGESGSKTVQLSAEQIFASRATIDLQFSSAIGEYLLSVPAGISLIHVPLKVAAVDGVAKTITSIADLYDVLGGADTVNVLITYDPQIQNWLSYFRPSDKGTASDKRLTDAIGIIAGIRAPVSLRLSGSPLGTDGSSTITLNPGINLVGVPLKDSRINRVSDLLSLDGISSNVSVIIVSDNGEFKAVGQPGDDGDIPVTGGQSFILTAQRAATVTISGEKWDNTAAMGAAPPVGNTDLHSLPTDTTPVLALRGSIDSPIGSGFRVIVKNRSTGRAATGVIGVEGIGYQLTIVDTEKRRAAQIGDSLEISARSLDPSIGVQPLRYTVTAEDVKRSQIQLPTLVAYEIPAETELLPNYPNPFNPETWIPYQLSEGSTVTVQIYDIRGHLIRTVDVGHKPMGYYLTREKAVYWDGRNENGEPVSSGVYFYTLNTDIYTQTRRMVIVK